MSGTEAAGLGGSTSGDMMMPYRALDMAVKMNMGDGLDMAVIVDHPYAAHTIYPGGTGYFAQGTTADLSSMAITGVLRYRMASNVSLLGGMRYQTLKATTSIPFVAGYTADTQSDSGTGYLVGVAYEKPEMALRVALTYNSSIKHDLDTVENGSAASVTDITTPQSLNLEAQSGINPTTMLFGSVRWVDWSSFRDRPGQLPADRATGLLQLRHGQLRAWRRAQVLGHLVGRGDDRV